VQQADKTERQCFCLSLTLSLSLSDQKGGIFAELGGVKEAKATVARVHPQIHTLAHLCDCVVPRKDDEQ